MTRVFEPLTVESVTEWHRGTPHGLEYQFYPDRQCAICFLLEELALKQEMVTGLTAAVEVAKSTMEQRCRDHGCGE